MSAPSFWQSLVEEVVPIRHALRQPDQYMREVLPDSSPNLVWLWQGGMTTQTASQWIQLPVVSLNGLLTHKKSYYTSLQVKGVIIKLRPWVLGLLKEHSALEATNQVISLDNTDQFTDLAEPTSSPLTRQSFIACLEPIFAHCFSGKPIDYAVVKAIQATKQHQTGTRIKALADQAAQCTRQFERRFKATTGLTPKQFVRNVRFERARNYLVLGYSLLDVTYACGYFDQTHFTREFKAISGITPKLFQQSKMSLFY